MSTNVIKPWVESVILHPDVLSPDFSEDIFALDLGPLADGNKNVPAVYRDPEQFFRASYLTNGLRSLLQDVLLRLSGGAGNRVMKLITPFGGGKSHTLASLYHAARNRKALDVIPEGKSLPNPGIVHTAVFDGQFFSPSNGKDFPGGKGLPAPQSNAPRQAGKANTLWGWVAWSLCGDPGYEILRKDDEARVAPGGDDIIKLLGDAPNLILLDEVLEYLISAGGIKVHDTTLRDETLNFLKRLTVAVGNTPNSVLVFSLQSSKRESLDYINLLQTIDHLAARKDQRREPVEGDEVLRVIQRRLLGKMPAATDSTPAATAYQEVVTQMRRAYAKTPAEQQQAEQEGIELRERIRAAYPFHPALIDLMRERWAAIPDFQRTRGALRFLAVCLRTAHAAGTSRAVMGPESQVLAFDLDPAAVELNYLQTKKAREERLLPLLLDLANPSPALGWAGYERESLTARGPAEMVLALALVHHLAISNNVPLPHVADFLAVAGRWLAVEFVPKSDGQVQRLLTSRPDIFPDYTREGFERSFGHRFQIREAVPVRDSERWMYLMEGRSEG